MPGIKAKRKQLVRKTLMRAKAQGERTAEQRQESPEEYAQTEVQQGISDVAARTGNTAKSTARMSYRKFRAMQEKRKNLTLQGSRADIDNAVSGAHRILVVLHDDQTVSEVTQMFQRREKFVVVSLVKTDARLVENIGDTDKAGADLRCQTDSLRLTAGQRCRSARQGQIV